MSDRRKSSPIGVHPVTAERWRDMVALSGAVRAEVSRSWARVGALLDASIECARRKGAGTLDALCRWVVRCRAR